MKSPVRFFSFLGIGALSLLGAWLLSGHPAKEVAYKDKPLSKWFYGKRSDFGHCGISPETTEALTAMGTSNVFPFLLAQLKAHGNSARYFAFYTRLPGPVQSQLPYPISGDDIHEMALIQLMRLPDLSEESLAALVKLIPSLPNPHNRIFALSWIGQATETRQRPLLIGACKTLLQDPNSGIRLESALCLARLVPHFTNSHPVLVDAIEHDESVKANVLDWSYASGKPPGASWSVPPPPPAGFGLATRQEQEKKLRERVLQTLDSLQLWLSPADQKLVRSRLSRPDP